MYTVKSGEQYAKITITDAETVKFSDKWDVFGVKGDDITVKLNSTDNGDGVYNTDDTGGAVIIAHGRRLDTMYLTGTGDVIVWAGASAVDCPFSKGGKGGGGSGGGCNYKGTTTTPISNGSTTNPITIDGEEYTAVFGDVVVYDYTEFVFDGTTWSEFGRPFDTTPTSGSANAVTSDGIYWSILGKAGSGAGHSVKFGNWDNSYSSGYASFTAGNGCSANSNYSVALNDNTRSNQQAMTAIGKFNSPRTGDLFNIGNGTGAARSNIVEVNSTEMNVNGNIKKNNVSLPTPYTTMPTITASMLGQIAMYVGETTNDYVKGYFYIASSDGAAEPTYSWVSMVDDTPTLGSMNAVTSNGVAILARKGTGGGMILGSSPYSTATSAHSLAFGNACNATGNRSIALGDFAVASGSYSTAIGLRLNSSQTNQFSIGKYNKSRVGDLFNIGNGVSGDNRSNILEANSTSVNINGDIQRNGVGIDDYTTTERKIGKWIDGSDLYQRTFEVTGIHNDGTYDDNILGTSDIVIRDWTGYIQYDTGTDKLHYPIHGIWFSATDWIGCWVTTGLADLAIHAKINTETYTLDKAVITIKYTKPSANANVQQGETRSEPVEEPIEDDMR